MLCKMDIERIKKGDGMIKATLFPKISRIGFLDTLITEKLDGSNLGIFNDRVRGLTIAQRNIVYGLDEIESIKNKMYKDLYSWLKEYGEDLKNSLYEGSGFFGEWIGQGHINYDFKNKFFIFAKANIKNLEIRNLKFDYSLLAYPFKDKKIPKYLSVVPLVAVESKFPNVEDLDELYKSYTGVLKRPVEGFVISHLDSVFKYVRCKNGKTTEHKTAQEAHSSTRNDFNDEKGYSINMSVLKGLKTV